MPGWAYVVIGFAVYVVFCLWVGHAERFAKRRRAADEWKRAMREKHGRSYPW
jgi:hypothetical protein